MSKCDASEFDGLADLACEINGAKIVFATDNFFADAPNMIKLADPIFLPEEFTEFGKWMDGWETRRKRTPGHDWCIIKLGMSGKIKGFDINTAFFSGNYAPRVSLQGVNLDREIEDYQFTKEMGSIANEKDYEMAEKLYGSGSWKELLSRKDMGAGYPETQHNIYKIEDNETYTHIRINIFPDGGVARLRVFGQPTVDWAPLIENKTVVDVAHVRFGGKGLGYSNAHYGKASNLIAPGRAAKMDEGWETKRKDGRPAILEVGEDGMLILPGDDWALIKLGHKSRVHDLLIDTNHFKGNFPESCIVMGCFYEGPDDFDPQTGDFPSTKWVTLVARKKLAAHEEVTFKSESDEIITHVRITIFPDGGVSRLRVNGTPV